MQTPHGERHLMRILYLRKICGSFLDHPMISTGIRWHRLCLARIGDRRLFRKRGVPLKVIWPQNWRRLQRCSGRWTSGCVGWARVRSTGSPYWKLQS